MQYNPGTATLAVPMGDGRWSVDSFRQMSESYVVDLQAGTCSCPHYVKRLAGTAGECKHLQSVRRQARFARLLEIAQGLTDTDLTRLLQKYTELGDVETAGALRCERARRRQEVTA